jgi:hypothetical protein
MNASSRAVIVFFVQRMTEEFGRDTRQATMRSLARLCSGKPTVNILRDI